MYIKLPNKNTFLQRLLHFCSWCGRFYTYCCINVNATAWKAARIQKIYSEMQNRGLSPGIIRYNQLWILFARAFNAEKRFRTARTNALAKQDGRDNSVYVQASYESHQ
jgi:hypothetical protein